MARGTTWFGLGGFLAGAAFLAACQQVLQPREAPSFQLADYSLHYLDTGATAKLAYGKANSETLGLMLECAKGERTVEITDVARKETNLSLRAGGKTSKFAGMIQNAPGAPIIAASAPMDAPALKAFRDTGKVTVTNGALVYDVIADKAERADVETFFAACERA